MRGQRYEISVVTWEKLTSKRPVCSDSSLCPLSTKIGMLLSLGLARGPLVGKCYDLLQAEVKIPSFNSEGAKKWKAAEGSFSLKYSICQGAVFGR